MTCGTKEIRVKYERQDFQFLITRRNSYNSLLLKFVYTIILKHVRFGGKKPLHGIFSLQPNYNLEN